MDVDEFLDRELSELDLPLEKTEKSKTSTDFPYLKEDFEPSPLFESIKANLGKGNLEQAERSYIQLWDILSQQKLKWNKELYEQLSVLSRHFSSSLNSAHNEVRRKAEHIYELISRARVSLKEGKKEIPFKLYSEIMEINNSIPNVFFEEKKIIEEQVMDFYKELRNTMDNELLKRVYALVQEIGQLTDKANLSIKSNDMINSIVNYNKCIELFNQIPEGFLRHKNAAGARLLEIYKSLSIYAEISNLQRQLGIERRELSTSASILTTRAKVSSLFESQGIQQPQKFQQQVQQQTQQQTAPINQTESTTSTRKDSAKKNIEKGLYNEASKDIEDALKIDPKDAEALAIRAKIKTLQ